MSEVTWGKILASMGEEPHPIAPTGCVPLYDGEKWLIVRNSMTVYPGVENCADPAKVDVLRENVKNLLEHYPETVGELAKLGAKVKPLMTRRIQTYSDVVAWAGSIFNQGPSSKHPQHIHETMDLAYDDFVIQVSNGRNPVYVIPAGPRGSGVNSTLDFSVPGSKTRYGPRHEYTKTAFAKQIPKKEPKPPRYRGKTAEGEPRRPRGRPRLDGLTPGSAEAKKADQKRKREREARRTARQSPAPRRVRLVRIGKKKAS